MNGLTAQAAIQGNVNQGPFVDLPMNVLSPGPQTCWPSTTCPFPAPIIGAFYTDSGTSSSFESAVLEQTQAPTPNMIAASTIALIDQNAATGAKTFFADGTTTTGLQTYFNTIRPNLSSYNNAANDLSVIDNAISSNGTSSGSPTGNQVLAPINGNMSVG